MLAIWFHRVKNLGNLNKIYQHCKKGEEHIEVLEAHGLQSYALSCFQILFNQYW
jgi:hypothetical protein